MRLWTDSRVREPGGHPPERWALVDPGGEGQSGAKFLASSVCLCLLPSGTHSSSTQSLCSQTDTVQRGGRAVSKCQRHARLRQDGVR